MRWLLTVAIILIIIGIVGLGVINFYAFVPAQPGVTRVPVRGPGTPRPSGSFTSNGEQIFFTGTSSRDTITTTGGPVWFQMHGGGCATCHGPDGRGGQVVMMGSFRAPDITYKTLTSQEHGNGRPYTDDLIKRAITRGIDSNGEHLSRNMPRWQMSNSDLNDVITYLKTLDP
ncbi:MAG: cytochrome c [Actinomycetota bacterium]|nr:cytochrome c [Actinomycetota bacterium]